MCAPMRIIFVKTCFDRLEGKISETSVKVQSAVFTNFLAAMAERVWRDPLKTNTSADA